MVQQPPMNIQFLGQRHDVVALLHPLDAHAPKLVRIPPHSSLGHLQLLSLLSVPIRVSQSRGSVHFWELLLATSSRINLPTQRYGAIVSALALPFTGNTPSVF